MENTDSSHTSPTHEQLPYHQHLLSECYICTISEPYSDTCYSWKSIVYVTIHSMDFDKYVMMCAHHHSIIQNSFTALEILCSLPIHPSLLLYL